MLQRAEVPLHCLTAGEPWPASLRSGRKTEDLLYKGSLRRHVTLGHGAHLCPWLVDRRQHKIPFVSCWYEAAGVKDPCYR